MAAPDSWQKCSGLKDLGVICFEHLKAFHFWRGFWNGERLLMVNLWKQFVSTKPTTGKTIGHLPILQTERNILQTEAAVCRCYWKPADCAPFLNSCIPNAPFLYLLKTLENVRKVFWCFHWVKKGCIGNEWVDNAASYVLLTLPEIVFVLDISLGNLRNFTPPDSNHRRRNFKFLREFSFYLFY